MARKATKTKAGSKASAAVKNARAVAKQVTAPVRKGAAKAGAKKAVGRPRSRG
jgi:hypothetical protein